MFIKKYIFTYPRLLFMLTLTILGNLIVYPNFSYAKPENQNNFFIGYEILEMSMNKFIWFAGELGYRFNDDWQFRFVVMEVSLTERHLSSDYEAVAIDGKNVKGYFRSYEANLDWFFTDHWYIGPVVGYTHNRYEHTVLDENIDNKTLAAGFGFGYSIQNLFGIGHLFLNFSSPFKYYFNSIEKQKLGDTTVRQHILINNLWLFVGYNF